MVTSSFGTAAMAFELGPWVEELVYQLLDYVLDSNTGDAESTVCRDCSITMDFSDKTNEGDFKSSSTLVHDWIMDVG